MRQQRQAIVLQLKYVLRIFEGRFEPISVKSLSVQHAYIPGMLDMSAYPVEPVGRTTTFASVFPERQPQRFLRELILESNPKLYARLLQVWCWTCGKVTTHEITFRWGGRCFMCKECANI